MKDREWIVTGRRLLGWAAVLVLVVTIPVPPGWVETVLAAVGASALTVDLVLTLRDRWRRERARGVPWWRVCGRVLRPLLVLATAVAAVAFADPGWAWWWTALLFVAGLVVGAFWTGLVRAFVVGWAEGWAEESRSDLEWPDGEKVRYVDVDSRATPVAAPSVRILGPGADVVHAAACGAWPDGETVLDTRGSVVASADPSVHLGALVPCYAPAGHRGKHTWQRGVSVEEAL